MGAGVAVFKVTVKVAEAVPPDSSVAVTVYEPGAKLAGMVKAVFALPNMLPTYAPATRVVPMVMDI